LAIRIETDRGPWVSALAAAGYTVYAVNPLQAARYRQRHSVSGAESDVADAHTLADMVRTDAHQLRSVAPDSAQAEAIKVVARSHKTLIWERTRDTLRLRHALREYFSAALEAFPDLDAPDTLWLLSKAPDPASAAKLTRSQIRDALKRARRHDIDTKTVRIQSTLRTQQLSRDPVITSAYAATTRSVVAVLKTLNKEIDALQGQVAAHFGQHPDAEIILSQPGLGRCSVPGYSPNSVTRQGVTSIPGRARTTPAPAPSPGSPANARSPSHDLCTTTDSSTHCYPRPNPRCRPHPVPTPTITNNAPAGSATTPPYVNWPTGWSAFCTGASSPAPSTTRPPHGHIRATINNPRLDI
jgi:hypothetical protein